MTEVAIEIHRGNILYHLAGPDDDGALKQLLRNHPMEGWVRLSLEREPSFFRGQSLMGESLVVIAQDKSLPPQTVGMYTCARLPVHLNGLPAELPYLGGLRIEPTFRHRLRLLKDGFEALPVLMGNPVPLAFTSLASENRTARRLLEANLTGMPRYQALGELTTLAIPARKGSSKPMLHSAGLKDVPILTAFFNQQSRKFQFGAHLEEAWLASMNGANGLRLSDFWLLKDGQELQGCFAVWDQRAFKQTVVKGYRPLLSSMRAPYNVVASIMGGPLLPAPGQALSNVFLCFIAFKDPAAEYAVLAIREGLTKVWEKGGEFGILGLSANHPLVPRFNRFLRAWSYQTCIESVCWPGNPVPSLDPLPVQPEIALL